MTDIISDDLIIWNAFFRQLSKHIILHKVPRFSHRCVCIDVCLPIMFDARWWASLKTLSLIFHSSSFIFESHLASISSQKATSVCNRYETFYDDFIKSHLLSWWLSHDNLTSKWSNASVSSLSFTLYLRHTFFYSSLDICMNCYIRAHQSWNDAWFKLWQDQDRKIDNSDILQEWFCLEKVSEEEDCDSRSRSTL